MKFQIGTILVVLLVYGCGSDFKSKHVIDVSSTDDGTSVVGSISASQAVADGVDQVLVTIKIINSRALPVRDITPRLLEDGTFVIISPCTQSNAIGESICRIASTRAGTRALHAISPSEFQVNVTFVPGPPAKMNIVAGDNQSTTVGRSVLIAPRVNVLDAFDNPISGLSISFTPSAGGSVVTSPAVTGNNGEAALTQWTLSTQAGANTLTAAIGALSVVFNATGMPENLNPLQLVYFPAGECNTGKIEVYVNNSPHPQYQFIDSEDCIEIEDNVARGTLRVRCIDMTGASLPSNFVGAAVDRRPKSSSVCKAIHRAA
jgi:hypothetical protein